jgi:predicted nucleic acid-binding protein
MELVIDANVLISALIKDSHTRHFLILSGNTFYVPEFVFEEINEHMNELKDKIGLSEYEIRDILEQIVNCRRQANLSIGMKPTTSIAFLPPSFF